MAETSDEFERLRSILARLSGAAVAFSGGTDSTFLLAVCLDVLGAERVLALTANSPLSPHAELAEAKSLAAALGAKHQVVESDELANSAIAANPPDRCYFCKRVRFEALSALAKAQGYSPLLHGENADDAADYRPGSRAAVELGVRAPLREAGLTKAQVRRLARERGLSNWDRPANACLASRFPYGTPLTLEALARVDVAESALRRLYGWRQLRVRDHWPIARLELLPADIPALLEPGARCAVVEQLRAAGYRYIALDLEGYRMGSLNDPL